MAVMAFESGETFSPSIRNRLSGATGLIQFMPNTARRLSTTTDALAAMTAEQQLDYAARYLAPYRDRLGTLEDMYMAVLWPRAVGAPNNTRLFARPSKAYEQNKGLDLNGDGAVSKFEAAAFVRDKLNKGLRPGYVG
jgi:soluble lytic murein transglycosylase-like protein